MILIGIAGKARSGKDTAGFHLADHWGMDTYAFADPLKAGLAAMAGLDDRHLYSKDKEAPLLDSVGQSPRQMMQSLGDWGRSVHPDFWVMRAAQWLEHRRIHGMYGHPGIVFTDCRYDNEAEFVRSKGGVIFHIHRDDADAVAPHSSECGITHQDGDYTIPNNSTINELCRRIDDIMRDIAGD